MDNWWRVDLWVVPWTNKCMLRMFRMVMCRFGRIVGLVPAAAPVVPRASCVFRRSNSKMILNVAALVKHLAVLFNDDRWPKGTKPIVLSGVQDEDLIQLKQQLTPPQGIMPKRQRGRLCSVPFTLSERGATAGMKGFRDAPGQQQWGNKKLVKRARDTLLQAGLSADVEVHSTGEPTAKCQAVRDMYDTG